MRGEAERLNSRLHHMAPPLHLAFLFFHHRTLDGKWFAAKAINANKELKGNYKLVSVPLIPAGGWHTFPSQNIPSLFNYGHIHYFALEYIQKRRPRRRSRPHDRQANEKWKKIRRGWICSWHDGHWTLLCASTCLTVNRNRSSAQCRWQWCCHSCFM